MPTLAPPVTPFYGGKQVINPANVLQTSGIPGTANIQNDLGTFAVDPVAQKLYVLMSKAGGVATWKTVTLT